MNFKILKEKIEQFEQKSNNNFSKQIVREFKSWFAFVENYISDIELENFGLICKIQSQDEMIEQLIKILIVTGNTDKLIALKVMDKEKVDMVLDFLIKSKSRVDSLYNVATLLEMAQNDNKQINSIKELKEYAGR